MLETKGNALWLEEFDRQVANLIQKGYPDIVGIEEDDFRKHFEPLKAKLIVSDTLKQEVREGHIPFVIVVKSDMVPITAAMALTGESSRQGTTVMDANDLQRFHPIECVPLPGGLAYLLIDIDTGQATRNLTPDAALEILQRKARSPLTIEEGVALITQYPGSVRKNNGFSLLGSRCGDRRVTALWISKGSPKLGWCWAGNPHTWLGSASCGGRIE